MKARSPWTLSRTSSVAFRVTVLSLLLCGIVYPLVVLAFAQLLPERARGSLVRDREGRALGSELIGQGFVDPAYLQPRPSAAGAGYDTTASGGSNLGPTSSRLRARVMAELARLLRENPEAPGPVPVELVTASASGLDPHLSVEAALWQLPRIARARGVEQARLVALLEALAEGRTFGFLGQERINVLRFNLELDRETVRPRPSTSGGAPRPRPLPDEGATP